jgi:hypothetical protein
MQWVRKNVRYGSWCALLAVMIHFAVSFGHAHRIDPLRQGMLFPQAGAYTQSVTEPDGRTSKPVGLAFDYCAICVVINLGASMMAASAPVSTGPATVNTLRYSRHADAPQWALAHPFFRARAPPFA